MMYLLENFLGGTLALPVQSGGQVPSKTIHDDILRPTGSIGFFASFPDSSTAYNATVEIYATGDGKTWLPTPVATLAVTNVAPDAMAVVNNCPWKRFGVKVILNSGTVTKVGNTNGRTAGGVVGVEG